MAVGAGADSSIMASMGQSTEKLEKPDVLVGSSNASTEAGEPMAPKLSETEPVWPAETMSTARQVLIVFVICMTQFCTLAGFTTGLYLAGTMGASFGVTDPQQLAWIVAGYSLTVGSFILPSGRLGDVFGYKLLLVIGLCWFALWSIVVGLSVYSNYVLLVFARVLQGIGPAICLPNCLAILGSTYPPGPKKAMIFACFGANAPLGAIIGATLAGVLALAWWPWGQWALGIFLSALAIAAYIVIPDPPQRNADAADAADGYTLRTLSEELDLPGAVTGVVALVVFNFAWNQAPLVGWDTAQVIVPLIVGLALVAVFAWYEFKVAKKPLLPFDVVNGDVAFVLFTVACAWGAFGVWALYFVRLLEEIRHATPLLTAAYISPVVPGGLVAGAVTGTLLGPLRVRPSVVMTCALTAFVIGVTLVATMPPNQIYWAQAFVCSIIIPFGMDMSFPAATLIISNAVKREHQGTGASLVNTIVNYSISLAVGFAGTVETNVHAPNQLDRFRGGLYFGIGIAVIGMLTCIMYLIREHLNRRKA